jgi:hypothetical protein
VSKRSKRRANRERRGKIIKREREREKKGEAAKILFK